MWQKLSMVPAGANHYQQSHRYQVALGDLRAIISLEAVWVLIWLGVGMIFRLWSFGWYPLREDEALYGYWARLISSGRDVMLEWVAIDKPPFFIYTLANAFSWFDDTVAVGRGVNIVCSFAALVLFWILARRIYGRRPARWALALYALSPFAIAFAPTMYTDPMLSAWILLALVAASYGMGLGAGLAIGMGFATKQTALLFLPLIVGTLILSTTPGIWRSLLVKTLGFRRDWRQNLLIHLTRLLLFSAGFYFVWFKVWQWDGWRILPAHIPDFWQQSWNSYGEVTWIPVGQWGQRWQAWWEVWRYLGGWLPGTLLLLLMAALPLAVMVRSLRAGAPGGRGQLLWIWRWDLLFSAFAFAFVFLHFGIGFQPWDRYLLGLAPLLALQGGRGLLLLIDRLAPRRKFMASVFLIAVVGVLGFGALRAASARIPIGGDHGAYAGIEEVASYLQEVMPRHRGVLYQRWLGWQWNWYLWERPIGRVYWSDPAMLIADLAPDPTGYQRYIVFPGWHLDEQTALATALAEHRLRLAERMRVAPPGQARPNFIVYQIVPERSW